VHRSLSLTALLSAALLLGARGGAAQSSSSSGIQQQFWPEVDYFQKLTDQSRLFAQVLAATGANDVVDNFQLGINLDLFLKPRPIFTPILGAKSLVEDRDRPMLLRLGYRYSETLNSSGVEFQNRLLAELTVKRNWSGWIASDRNGFDWRWTDGVYSTRYRNRVYIEHVIDTKHLDALKLRQQYYPRFEAVLKPKQVARYFQMEHRMDLLVQMAVAQQIPLIM
jgi:hypothetical protein